MCSGSCLAAAAGKEVPILIKVIGSLKGMGMWECIGFFFCLCFGFREITDQTPLEIFSDCSSEISAVDYFCVFFRRTEDGSDAYLAINVTMVGTFGDNRITAGSCNASCSSVWRNVSASVQCSGEDDAVTAAVYNLMDFLFFGGMRSVSSSDDSSGGPSVCYNT